jgi:quercetin 2,3-dioxygenase
MFQIRRAAERDHASQGWLERHRSFTEADAPDDPHPPPGALYALNDECIAPTRGFNLHPHRDLEIVSYVLEGALAHRDSLGNGAILRAGDAQRLSAGSGILHSTYNASCARPLRVLQVWLRPAERGGRPAYAGQRHADAGRRGLRALASPDGRDGSLSLRADAAIYAGLFDGAEAAAYRLPAGRHAYVHVARGALTVNGERLEAGDGARIDGVDTVTLAHGEQAEILLFDLG